MTRTPAAQTALAAWRPKLVEMLAACDRRTFAADLVAGLTVGAVAPPLAMAFGIASGVTPQAGIDTAIVSGSIVSLLGGSSIQVSGPRDPGAAQRVLRADVGARRRPAALESCDK